MNKRLEQFLAAENISQSQFADEIKVTRASVSHILAGRNKPGFDFLLETMRHYPALNMEWLIDGKGKMYKSSERDANPQSEPEQQKGTANTQEGTANTGPNSDAESLLPFPEISTKNESDTRKPIEVQEESLKEKNKTRQIVKVMVMYDDGTFEELA